MEFISTLASNFMGLFNAGGEQFVNWVTGIIPTVVCLMVAVNSIIKIIGRYLILPFLAVFCLGNPMMYTFGRFVDEKYKAAYMDATVSFCHPVVGLFPHANAGELFVFLGIADGITKLGLDRSALALRYLIVGLIVMFIRGIVTERIYLAMHSKNA